MTQGAHQVLDDCRFVLARLEDERNDQSWRIYWVAAVTLLRAVGHVLVRVDGKDQRVRSASEALFKEWKGSRDPAHQIFVEFIESERNNVVKEYAIGVSEGPLSLIIDQSDTNTGDFISLERYTVDENIYRPMAEGPYQGEDGRTLIELAIKWWEQQLDEVERRARLVTTSLD